MCPFVSDKGRILKRASIQQSHVRQLRWFDADCSRSPSHGGRPPSSAAVGAATACSMPIPPSAATPNALTTLSSTSSGASASVAANGYSAGQVKQEVPPNAQPRVNSKRSHAVVAHTGTRNSAACFNSQPRMASSSSETRTSFRPPSNFGGAVPPPNAAKRRRVAPKSPLQSALACGTMPPNTQKTESHKVERPIRPSSTTAEKQAFCAGLGSSSDATPCGTSLPHPNVVSQTFRSRGYHAAPVSSATQPRGSERQPLIGATCNDSSVHALSHASGRSFTTERSSKIVRLVGTVVSPAVSSVSSQRRAIHIGHVTAPQTVTTSCSHISSDKMPLKQEHTCSKSSSFPYVTGSVQQRSTSRNSVVKSEPLECTSGTPYLSGSVQQHTRNSVVKSELSTCSAGMPHLSSSAASFSTAPPPPPPRQSPTSTIASVSQTQLDSSLSHAPPERTGTRSLIKTEPVEKLRTRPLLSSLLPQAQAVVPPPPPQPSSLSNLPLQPERPAPTTTENATQPPLLQSSKSLSAKYLTASPSVSTLQRSMQQDSGLDSKQPSSDMRPSDGELDSSPHIKPEQQPRVPPLEEAEACSPELAPLESKEMPPSALSSSVSENSRRKRRVHVVGSVCA